MLCKNMYLPPLVFTFAILLCACSNDQAADQTVARPNASVQSPRPVPKLAQSSDLPEDVVKFLKRRKGCEHFRGEEGYDEARSRFIAEKLKTLCTGTDAELATLKRRFSAEPKIMAALGPFEEMIESEPRTKEAR